VDIRENLLQPVYDWIQTEETSLLFTFFYIFVYVLQLSLATLRRRYTNYFQLFMILNFWVMRWRRYWEEKVWSLVVLYVVPYLNYCSSHLYLEIFISLSCSIGYFLIHPYLLWMHPFSYCLLVMFVLNNVSLCSIRVNNAMNTSYTLAGFFLICVQGTVYTFWC
jgi:hypothetical protein